jgi:acetyl-CoA C-acetyltransferase
MSEAVIVATARSPIGRAVKGTLTQLRPDDLAATIIRTALDKVPQLDPTDIDDLMLGCGLPGGEQGFNMARVVAVLLGYDHLPGTTITRYCSSSLQTTRMAFHAIKAGEGDVFVSAGVECVSRYARGNSDALPAEAQALVGGGWQNPRFADAYERSTRRAEGGAETWHDPREDGELPDVYLAMGHTAENLAQAYAARTSRRRPSPTGSGSARSPR